MLVLECLCWESRARGVTMPAASIDTTLEISNAFPIEHEHEHEDDLVAAWLLCDLCGLLLKIPGFGRVGLVRALPT
ncbi:MAG TPA: hypothetical protein VE641_13405 [Chthoniobacterales bacterium]|nr:hypothetical protein [Chthoniobacterales bacterium]